MNTTKSVTSITLYTQLSLTMKFENYFEATKPHWARAKESTHLMLNGTVPNNIICSY